MTEKEKIILKNWGNLLNIKKRFFESYKKYRKRIIYKMGIKSHYIHRS